MNTDYTTQFFTLAGTGLALCAAGAANLAFRKLPLVRAILSASACAAVAGGLSLIVSNEIALRAGGAALAAVAAVALLGTEAVARRASGLTAALRRPSVRWGLVVAGGLLLTLGAGLAYDRAEQDELNATSRDLNLFTGRPQSHPLTTVRLTTDLGAPVTAREPDEVRSRAALTEPEARLLANGNHTTNLIRLEPADDKSNCHGWVFTGGKFILSPDDVELILKDNGYELVQNPQPGDVVVYRQNGGVAHTAVVRYTAPDQPVMVAGKWGVLGVFLHAVDKSCYGTDFAYYRSARSGHVVAGANGSPSTITGVAAE